MPPEKKEKADDEGFTKSIDWDKYTPDEFVNAKVLGIREATRRELFGDDAQVKFEGNTLEDVLIQVKVRLDNQASTILRFTLTPSLHPSSNLIGWKKAFGGLPKAGQKIVMRFNAESGFYEPDYSRRTVE